MLIMLVNTCTFLSDTRDLNTINGYFFKFLFFPLEFPLLSYH